MVTMPREESVTTSDGFAQFLREQLSPLGPITLRRLFGTTAIFCDGAMLGLLRDGAAYFRVDETNRAAYEQSGESAPFSYTRRSQVIDLPYWRVPEHLLDDPETLVAWASAALAAAQRVAARRKPKRRAAPH